MAVGIHVRTMEKVVISARMLENLTREDVDVN